MRVRSQLSKKGLFFCARMNIINIRKRFVVYVTPYLLAHCLISNTKYGSEHSIQFVKNSKKNTKMFSHFLASTVRARFDSECKLLLLLATVLDFIECCFLLHLKNRVLLISFSVSEQIGRLASYILKNHEPIVLTLSAYK